MPNQKPFAVVLAPFPITPIVCIGYFVYRQAGLITEETPVFYHWRPQSKEAGQPITGFGVLSLLGSRLYQNLRKTISILPPGSNWHLLFRIANYCGSPPRGAGEQNARRFIQQLCVEWESPKQVLEMATACLQKCLETQRDPFLSGLLEIPSSARPKIECPSRPSSQLYLTLPLYEDESDYRSPIVGHRRVCLNEERICELSDQHLGIIIGGPAGSGKSTITATLADEMENILLSLQSRQGWENFHLTIRYLNLDLGTPTVEAIASREGVDRNTLSQAKRPWTEDLALEALDAFSQAKQTTNVVIADLPGKTSHFTHLVALPADAGIIITHNWDMMEEWTKFLSRLGKPLLAQARTRLPQEGLESAVKRYHKGRILSGRVTGLDRIVRSWDPFISTLAKVLLFDLLPTLVEQRRHVIQTM